MFPNKGNPSRKQMQQGRQNEWGKYTPITGWLSIRHTLSEPLADTSDVYDWQQALVLTGEFDARPLAQPVVNMPLHEASKGHDTKSIIARS